MRQYNAIITIAYRDFTKFLRDRTRILATFIFPFIFIGVLGSSLQSNLGAHAIPNPLAFTFTGVLGQTLFQSTASGIISLIEDRENDFSQEIFVSPISRYSIVVGKIMGESSIAFAQALGIIIFGLILQIPLSWTQAVTMLPAFVVACMLGGAFGMLVMANLSSQRAANQIFPFVIFPQFFLAGVFSPIKDLPGYLWVLSRISPMTYAVDVIRNFYYAGTPQYSKVVLYPLWLDMSIVSAMFVVFLFVGTWMFVRNERNR